MMTVSYNCSFDRYFRSRFSYLSLWSAPPGSSPRCWSIALASIPSAWAASKGSWDSWGHWFWIDFHPFGKAVFDSRRRALVTWWTMSLSFTSRPFHFTSPDQVDSRVHFGSAHLAHVHEPMIWSCCGKRGNRYDGGLLTLATSWWSYSESSAWERHPILRILFLLWFGSNRYGSACIAHDRGRNVSFVFSANSLAIQAWWDSDAFSATRPCSGPFRSWGPSRCPSHSEQSWGYRFGHLSSGTLGLFLVASVT